MKKKTPILVSVVAAGSMLISGCSSTENTSRPAEPGGDLSSKNEAVPVVSPPDSLGDKPAIPPPPPVKELPTVKASQKYKNGTYFAQGSYTSPAGNETLSAEVVIENDVITGISITPEATNETSIKMQNFFAQDISSVLVGKKIDDIKNIAAVNGSSLSGKGFMNALAQIKSDAEK